MVLDFAVVYWHTFHFQLATSETRDEQSRPFMNWDVFFFMGCLYDTFGTRSVTNVEKRQCNLLLFT